MGGRIGAQLALVVGGGENLARMHQECAYRHVVVGERALGLPHGETHEVDVVVAGWVVVGDEIVHRS